MLEIVGDSVLSCLEQFSAVMCDTSAARGTYTGTAEAVFIGGLMVYTLLSKVCSALLHIQVMWCKLNSPAKKRQS